MQIYNQELCVDLFKTYKKYELNSTWMKLAGAIRLLTSGDDNTISANQIYILIDKRIELELIWGILKIFEKHKMIYSTNLYIDSSNEVFVVNDEYTIQRLFETVELLGNIQFKCSNDNNLYWTPPKNVDLNLKSLKGIKRIDILMSKIIACAREELIFFAPFYSAQGLGRISETLLPLMRNQKDLDIIFFCNDLDNYDKRNRVAFEHLKNLVKEEFEELPYKIYIPNQSALGHEDIFVHAKFILSDKKTGYLGSANISRNALELQLELGIRLEEKQCHALKDLLNKLIEDSFFLDVTDKV